MRVLQARNVHQIIPKAVDLMNSRGKRRDSRGGPVLVLDEPVASVYERPEERVVFWPQRDANPAFHLYESLWMLAGQRDVAPLARYVKQILEYSDDGQTLHDAYGWRWRRWFGEDQLEKIIRMLTREPLDRRAVLQIWDADVDLEWCGKALPCNLTATFQIGNTGRLDMTVFCRSNDIVWGAYGANAVHFSVLQEYVARHLERPVGTYTHVSVNWHTYLSTYGQISSIPMDDPYHLPAYVDPYSRGEVRVVPMPKISSSELYRFIVEEWAELPPDSLFWHDGYPGSHPWWNVVFRVLRAHKVWRSLPAPERFTEALRILGPREDCPPDWIQAMREWIERRQDRWAMKAAREHETLGEA